MDRKPTETQNAGESVSFVEESSVFVSGLTGWLKSFFPNLRDAAIRWSEDDASSLAAAVAYYLALSLFPMMLLLTSGIGLFFEFSNFGRDAEVQILDAVEQQTSPVVKQQIEEVLHQLRNQSLISGPFGMIAAILAAIGVFAQIDRGFDRIFRIPIERSSTMQRTIYNLVRHRCLAFLMLVCLGGTILILFASSMVLAQFRSITGSTLPSLQHVFGLFDTVVTIALNGVLFGMVYHWLPKKKVYWTDALRGGLLAALIWELGRSLLGVFFIGMRYTSAYGVIGSFIAILLWCYYGISILFFGAEYVQVLALRRAKSPDLISPSNQALGAGGAGVLIEVEQVVQTEENGEELKTDAAATDVTVESSSANSRSEAGRPLIVAQVDADRQQPRRTHTTP